MGQQIIHITAAQPVKVRLGPHECFPLIDREIRQAMAQRNAAEETERATTVEERTAHTLELLKKMLLQKKKQQKNSQIEIAKKSCWVNSFLALYRLYDRVNYC